MKLFRLIMVFALAAMMLVACSPNAGNNPGGDTETEEPGTNPDNPGTDVPEVELPEGAPTEVNGTLAALKEALNSNVEDNVLAGNLLSVVCGIGQQEASAGSDNPKVDETLMINGAKLDTDSMDAYFWGSFLMKTEDMSMHANGRVSVFGLVFDINGTMSETGGSVTVNGTDYTFSPDDVM